MSSAEIKSAHQFFTVSEITVRIRELLERQFYRVEIEGEVSGFRPSSTGHYYFNLIDSDATLSVALFKNRHRNLKFIPTDGMLVRAKGTISVYNRRGSYQLIAESLEQSGKGDILEIIEERKRALAAEGLFDQTRKRPLPILPQNIAIITSPTGAVIRDIIRVIGRRNPGIDLVILPTQVQGPGAAERITQCVRTADQWEMADVIIIARGGGSVEDLLPFSDEQLARAIAAAKTPIISAVGHEIDTALSDLAADHRAPTPSVAAEIVSTSRTELEQRINALKSNLFNALETLWKNHRNVVEKYSEDNLERSFRLLAHPVQQRLDEIQTSISHSISSYIQLVRHRLELAIHGVKMASPQTVLRRGYAVVTNLIDGSYVTTSEQLYLTQEVEVQLHETAFQATITKIDSKENDGVIDANL